MPALQPPKLAVVRRDGRWHDGELPAWRSDVGGWVGSVRYTVSSGLRHLEWVSADRVRPPATIGVQLTLGSCCRDPGTPDTKCGQPLNLRAARFRSESTVEDGNVARED
jgi:hypothetical protein